MLRNLHKKEIKKEWEKIICGLNLPVIMWVKLFAFYAFWECGYEWEFISLLVAILL